MNGLRRDVRFAARQLGKHPGFTVVAILTLGLGIGSTTAFFSILNTFTFRALPYADADRLVLMEGRHGWRDAGISYPDFTAIRSAGGALDEAAAYSDRAFNMGVAGASRRATGAAVTEGFFGVFGVAPAVGRVFAPSEDRPGADRVVVLSHAAWERDFASDPRVLGRQISLDGVTHTVVGVAPARFSYPDGAELWVPLGASPSGPRDERHLRAVARLRPGVSAERAEQAVAAASRGLAQAYPATNGEWSAALTPLREVMGAKLRGAAVVLLVASTVVLLLACANLAGLHLVLVSARSQELAIRAALGADRRRIVRLLVTEGLLLALAGGTLGIAIAALALKGMVGLLGRPGGAEWMEFDVDYRVFLFALLLSTGAGIAASLASALRGSRAGLRAALQEGGWIAGAGARRQRLRRGLVAAQVALSLPLVIGAATLMLSSWRVEEIDRGFDHRRLVALRVSLAGAAYDAPEERTAFVEQVLPRLAALPGVEGVTAASHAPLFDRHGIPWTTFRPERWDSTGGEAPGASMRFVTADYHRTLGIPLLRGRTLTPAEARDARAPVAVISEGMARRFWPAGEAVGARIRVPDGAGAERTLTVVGVVGDVLRRKTDSWAENQIYLALPTAREISLVLRTAARSESVVPRAQAAVASVDPALPLYDVRTVGDVLAWHFRDRLGQAAILGALGVTALLLALLGVYGVMAFAVAQRTREFGVRIALGGRRGDLVRLVLRDGAGVIAIGGVIGLALAMGAVRFLRILFTDLPAFQPILFLGLVGLLGLAVLAASYLPARRATRVDPNVVLRAE